jgi:hypothetical protein
MDGMDDGRKVFKVGIKIVRGAEGNGRGSRTGWKLEIEGCI